MVASVLFQLFSPISGYLFKYFDIYLSQCMCICVMYVCGMSVCGMCVYVVCVYVFCMCHIILVEIKSWFSSSIMWVSGIEHC